MGLWPTLDSHKGLLGSYVDLDLVDRKSVFTPLALLMNAAMNLEVGFLGVLKGRMGSLGLELP